MFYYYYTSDVMANNDISVCTEIMDKNECCDTWNQTYLSQREIFSKYYQT